MLAGITRSPDPQVAAATASYRPMPPETDPSHFGHVVDIARDALAGLVPVVLVSRRVDTALATLSGAPDADMPTIHTVPPPGVKGASRRVGRMLSERLHETHGTGPNAGRTVFGSTRFVGTADAQAGAAAVLAALARQGDVGVGAYGPVSMLVHPDALAGRTTFAARDTALGMTRVTDATHLPEVVAERIARGVPGAPSTAQLVGASRLDATRSLRDWLTSDGPSRRDGYIEAQVRGLAPADLDGVHLARSYDGPVMKKIDPGPLPTDADAARLSGLAAKLGLAFSDAATAPGNAERRPEGRRSIEPGLAAAG
ncbi:MAG: hypothetical protein JWM86_2211 [Thermoleophilia bacterium]|nr:hypothetical protein [Thermoleophilia bacterium]